MSSTQSTVQYVTNGAVQGSAPDGTEFYGTVTLTVEPGSTFTDEDAAAIQQKLVAAFPADWSVTNSDIPIQKIDTTLVQYATNYTTTPPSFT